MAGQFIRENEPYPLPPEPEFLTVKQTAKYLNVSQGCVYRLCITKKLTHYKFAEGRGAIRLRRADLLDYVLKCRIEEREAPNRFEDRPRRAIKNSRYVYKHLRLEPEHLCGALTSTGTLCTRMTQDERCYQHKG